MLFPLLVVANGIEVLNGLRGASEVCSFLSVFPYSLFAEEPRNSCAGRLKTTIYSSLKMLMVNNRYTG